MRRSNVLVWIWFFLPGRIVKPAIDRAAIMDDFGYLQKINFSALAASLTN